MAYVTPGGSTRLQGPAGPLPAATAIVARLVVRQIGETVDAGLTAPTSVTADPPFPFTVQPSGDGHFLHITPTDFLPPGRTFSLHVNGGWTAADRSGAVDDTIRFRTAPVKRRGPPWRRGDAFRLSRLAVPLPPILPSLNQIGFDSYEMAVGALKASKGRLLLWAVSTKPGTSIADRQGAFAFPLSGRYRDDSLLLSQSGLTLTFSFGDVPLRRFDLRMQMGADRRARGASLTAEVFCPEVPVYGAAAAGHRPLQQRRHPAVERHVHHRPLPRPGEPQAEGRAPGEPPAGSWGAHRGCPLCGQAAPRKPPCGCHPADGRRDRSGSLA